uniref:Squamous cell carcinoma antigen recognized by T-cells 3-like n=1 Tax=Saccoglossus kowalevskii TaxID=10224 RepID=A0ABM0MM47_SACKO|nr:PREDICTED: squamous cell carcinoma antigen recognized by T-cells 3-like [Saccoglossus kowalevskii]
MSLTSEESGRDHINALFERAVKDYMCVGIWLEYVQYSIGGMAMKDGISNIRKVFERSITAVGLHVTKGATLWEAYREFESILLATIQPGAGQITTAEKQSEIDAQTEKIDALFRRQLSIPLMDMESTYEEYEEWSTTPIPDHLKHSYQKALLKLKNRTQYEDALLTAEPPRLAEYKSYIEYEKSEGEPTRIQCIYERSLEENCLVPELWLDYTKYVDNQLKIGSVSLNIHTRAVRNCPWTMLLWQHYLQSLERYKQPHDKVKETFEKAINSGFSQGSDFFVLWQTYIDYMRRRIDWHSENEVEVEEFRLTIRRAIEYLTEYFGLEADPTCSLHKYWATIEAKHLKNKQAARELWDEVVSVHGKEAQTWLEYINFERMYGDNKHCRKVLVRAVQSTSDWPESVCEAYINFEREEGTLEQYEAAVVRVESQMNRVNERRNKAAEKEAELTKQQEEVSEFKRQAKAAKKAEKQPIKRKADERTESVIKRKESNNPPQENVFKVPFLPPGMPGRKTDDSPPPKKQKTDESTMVKGAVSHDPSKDCRTVFVKNLSYNLKENKIRSIFAECGEITEVRMVTNYKQKFKGFCYVEFKDEFAADKALKLDRQPIDGRPMFVDPSLDKTKKASQPEQFQWSTNMEKNKLFISGLPRSVNRKMLEELFGKHGDIKDIRIVTYKSGAPKGLAYVEYVNEGEAAKAVLATDGTQMGEHRINVAISNPPPRKPKQGSLVEDIEELQRGQRGSGFGPRGKGRTQLAFMPRAIKKQQSTAADVGSGDKMDTGGSSKEPKMSNADFAKLFSL